MNNGIEHIILGSSSPRRKEILSYFTLPFIQASPTFDESALLFGGNPESFVNRMAKEKALSLVKQYKEPILTADTIVYCQKKLFMKPKTELEALHMLQALSGGSASVFTGVCVAWNDEIFVHAEESQVFFNDLTDEQVKKYHSLFDWQNRSGGFYIQKGGSIVIRQIIGLL